MPNFAELLASKGEATDRFRCWPPATDEKRVFGGQLLGQALAAAALTAQGRRCHAMHALFVGPGKPSESFSIEVERLRDGRSFATRRIETLQGEHRVLSALLSFDAEDDGPEHQVDMPEIPPPEQLRDQREIRRENAQASGGPVRTYLAESMLDARPVDLPVDTSRGVEGRRCLWFRSRMPLADDHALHQAVIAFASDMGLVTVSLKSHNALGDGRPLETASLDHSIRFHRPGRADEWLLHVQKSPTSTRGRGLAEGEIFARDGSLVATVSQSTLLRYPHRTGR